MKVQDVVITPADREGVVRVTLSWEEGRLPYTLTVDVPVEQALEIIRDTQPDAVHLLRRRPGARIRKN